MNGPRLGWTLGGAGGLLWIPILSVLLFMRGRPAAGIAGLAVFGAGLVFIVVFSPWKHPEKPVRSLYAGLLGIFLAAAVVMMFIWAPGEAHAWFPARYLVCLAPLLIPFFTLGRRTWTDFHGASSGADRKSGGGSGGKDRLAR